MKSVVALIVLTLSLSAVAGKNNEALERDAQNYLQTKEMSSILANQVHMVISQNTELSVEEAVIIVLQTVETQSN